MPILIGRAITRASVEETNVPHMNGNAPKSFWTGSHSLENIKLKPNASKDNLEE